MSDDPLAFLRERKTGPTVERCRYAIVRDSLPDKVRDALLAVEDDQEVQSTRILALIRMHTKEPLGITTVRRHRVPEGCPTCNKESS
jgi:hypothetical protein